MVNLSDGIPWGDFLGIIGVILYIGSYFGLQAGYIRGQGYLYATLNTAAATCVLLSLVEHFNLSSAIIQVTYICISVFGMVRFYILTQRIRFSEEEQSCLNVLGPNLSKIKARQLMNLGTWATAMPGTVLTEEGKPVLQFCFLLDGGADVNVAGANVAKLGPKSLIGEMSRMTGMTASASVSLTEPSRLFSIDVKKMNKFLAQNADVTCELESRFANQISEKLIRANTALLDKR